jgi:hypothetical protein
MGLFSWVEETHVSLKWTPSLLEAGVSITFLFLWKSSKFLKEYLLANHNFHGEEILIMVQFGLLICFFFSYFSYVHTMLGSFRSINPIKRITCIPQWTNALFPPNRPTELSWKNTWISPSKTINVRSCWIWHIVFLRIEVVFKGILAANPTFQGGKGSFCP